MKNTKALKSVDTESSMIEVQNICTFSFRMNRNGRVFSGTFGHRLNSKSASKAIRTYLPEIYLRNKAKIGKIFQFENFSTSPPRRRSSS